MVSGASFVANAPPRQGLETSVPCSHTAHGREAILLGFRTRRPTGHGIDDLIALLKRFHLFRRVPNGHHRSGSLAPPEPHRGGGEADQDAYAQANHRPKNASS